MVTVLTNRLLLLSLMGKFVTNGYRLFDIGIITPLFTVTVNSLRHLLCKNKLHNGYSFDKQTFITWFNGKICDKWL